MCCFCHHCCCYCCRHCCCCCCSAINWKLPYLACQPCCMITREREREREKERERERDMEMKINRVGVESDLESIINISWNDTKNLFLLHRYSTALQPRSFQCQRNCVYWIPSGRRVSGARKIHAYYVFRFWILIQNWKVKKVRGWLEPLRKSCKSSKASELWREWNWLWLLRYSHAIHGGSPYRSTSFSWTPCSSFSWICRSTFSPWALRVCRRHHLCQWWCCRWLTPVTSPHTFRHVLPISLVVVCPSSSSLMQPSQPLPKLRQSSSKAVVDDNKTKGMKRKNFDKENSKINSKLKKLEGYQQWRQKKKKIPVTFASTDWKLQKHAQGILS